MGQPHTLWSFFGRYCQRNINESKIWLKKQILYSLGIKTLIHQSELTTKVVNFKQKSSSPFEKVFPEMCRAH